jgi:chemotaxis protein methyltransferase CheR
MSNQKWLSEDVIEVFNRLITKQTGIIIREQDRDSFCEKIYLRTQAVKAGSPVNYYQFLESNTLESYQEWEKLIALLANNESYFFRDKEQLNLLKNQILPDLIKRNRTQKTLRICSAGCSTGQEPYTIAIMLKELLPDFQQWNLLILGIDIDRHALEEAEKGVYENWSFRGVDDKIKKQYFQHKNNQYYLVSDIKKIVKFQVVNLVKDVFPQLHSELREMDLILCRNVFIYFDNSAIAKVLNKIYQTLRPSGYFVTGHTELSAQNLSQFDKVVFPASIIYQRPCQPKAQSEIIEKKSAIAPLTEPIISHKKNTTLTPETSLKLNSNNNFARSTQPKIASFSQPNISEILTEVENLLLQEKYELAIAPIQKVLKIDPQNLKAYYFFAQIQANLGQYERAIEACHQALKIDNFASDKDTFPWTIAIHYLLAQIAEEQQDLENAKRILKQIIYLEPNSVSAYLDLSHIYAREGDLKRTKKMQKAALDILQQLPPDTKIQEKGNITAAELLESIHK